MRVTPAQARIIDECVRLHRTGAIGLIDTGKHWIDGKWRTPFSSRSIKQLALGGLIKIDHEPDGPHCIWRIEMTPKGWDHIYKVR